MGRQNPGRSYDPSRYTTPHQTPPKQKKKTNLKIKAQGFEFRLSLLAKWFSGTGEGNRIESSANASPLGPTRPSLNLCNQRRSCIQTPVVAALSWKPVKPFRIEHANGSQYRQQSAANFFVFSSSDQDESCEVLEALVTLRPGSSGPLFLDGLGGHC